MHGLEACIIEYITVASFHIYVAKGEVSSHAINSHGTYIVDHRKSWKNYGIVF